MPTSAMIHLLYHAIHKYAEECLAEQDEVVISSEAVLDREAHVAAQDSE